MKKLNCKNASIVFILLMILFTLFNSFLVYYNPERQGLKISALSEEIPEINLSTLPQINLPELNKTWYDPKIEMIIITPHDTNFVNAVTPLANWKNKKGVKTIIFSNFSKYDGKDNAEKIRNLIKHYFIKENLKWVLLAGDAQDNLIPIRYVYNPDVVEISGQTEYDDYDDYYKPTDFYYADLNGTWDEDGDGKWGESPKYNDNGVDEIEWTPDVYVGRFPADDDFELSLMANKTLNYETKPTIGDWMNRMLLAGGVSSYKKLNTPDEDEARLTQYIWHNYTIYAMNFTHLIKTTSSFTPLTPPPPNKQKALNSTSFKSEFNKGYSTVIFAGHGDPTQLTDASSTIFYSNTDAQFAKNINMPSLFYADACTVSPYDQGDNSIGELLFKHPSEGAIGFIGAMRVSWYFEGDTNLEKVNRGNAKLFWQQFFEEKKFQQGKALYDSKVAYLHSVYFTSGRTSINYEYQRKNVLTYNLLGDPELDIYTNKPVLAMKVYNNTYYEGQLVSVVILDTKGNPVPNARVHLTSKDGKYFTCYADENGLAKFRLLPQAGETYNVTITGHNLIPSYFNFTTVQDRDKPKLISLDFYPTQPSISDNIKFYIKASDNQSGLESVFILISDNNFESFKYYQLSNGFNENFNNFNFILPKLKPGDYSFAIVLRDFTNKMSMYFEKNYNFSIPTTLTDAIIPVAFTMIFGLIGVSFAWIYLGIHNSKKRETGI